MLEYLQSELGLAYRTRLTKHALGTYLDPPASGMHQLELGEKDGVGRTGDDGKGEQLFYKLANLDDRIKNADQVGEYLTIIKTGC
jgi:ATP-binding cassette subfamily D (ALD) long-chain fatty acid import protein